jgi:prepilin-type processing-associated H-X9-DG protein
MSRPKAVNINNDGTISISWMDGATTKHSMAQLRRDCPCAHCRIEREKLKAPGPVLRVLDSSAPSPQKAEIVEFSPVGRYALNFLFNDGHSTGIYTFDFLKETALE